MHGVIPVSGDRGTADAVIPQRGSAVTAPAPTAAYCSAPAGGNRIEADGTTVLRFRGDRVVERRNRLDDIAFRSRIGAN